MVETTNAYISFVDEAMRRMGWLGNDGRDYCRILEILFIDPEWHSRGTEERLKETGLTTRQFYDRRRKAIEMFSKILWVLLDTDIVTLFFTECNNKGSELAESF